LRKFSSYKVVFIILICGCCVDPFNTSLSVNKTLVVDGLLTDQHGPHTITLSYSSDLGVGATMRELASGASVSILDGTGVQTPLTEVSQGAYQTDSSFQAQEGKSYFIRISLNSQSYESEVETLLPAGQLDSLYFKIQSTPLANQFQFYANSGKVQQSNGLMRWRSSFIFQILTWPQLSEDPPPCSNPCTCCTCWVYGHNNDVVVGSGSNFIDNKFNNNLVASIPIDDQRFQIRYYLTVDQLSLSTSAYNFWNLVVSQKAGAGSLFQPASARVQGNIHSTTNPNEQVLGLFQVSSVVSKSIFINRSDVPYNMRHDPPFLNMTDCRGQGTNIRPSFW